MKIVLCVLCMFMFLSCNTSNNKKQHICWKIKDNTFVYLSHDINNDGGKGDHWKIVTYVHNSISDEFKFGASHSGYGEPELWKSGSHPIVFFVDAGHIHAGEYLIGAVLNLDTREFIDMDSKRMYFSPKRAVDIAGLTIADAYRIQKCEY